MYLMQYEIVLPADYDMAIIERRVAERGMATDDLATSGSRHMRSDESAGTPRPSTPTHPSTSGRTHGV
jgi:hypothetical protein